MNSTPYILATAPLLELIHTKELTPIGWGCGQLFQLRRFIHDFDVAFTIHTCPPTREIESVPVYDPSVLNGLDHARHILIIYTIDFFDEALRHSKLYPALPWLPFNAAELGVAPRLRQLRAAADAFCPQGVSYGSAMQLHNELGY